MGGSWSPQSSAQSFRAAGLENVPCHQPPRMVTQPLTKAREGAGPARPHQPPPGHPLPQHRPRRGVVPLSGEWGAEKGPRPAFRSTRACYWP